MTRFSKPMAVAAIVILCAVVAACGGGGDNATSIVSGTPDVNASPLTQTQAETFMRGLADDYNSANGDSFLARFTDHGLAAFLGDTQTSPSDLRDEAKNFVGEIQINVQGVDGVTSTGGRTTLNLNSIQEKMVVREQFVLVQENGQALIDDYARESPIVPPGTTSVPIGAVEARYDFDASKVTSGNVAFVLTNNGTQHHEIVLTKVDTSPTLAELEQSAAAETDPTVLPDGFVDVLGTVTAPPGASATMVLAQPLAAGRYAFFDFTPDASNSDGETFATEGMGAEFTVS